MKLNNLKKKLTKNPEVLSSKHRNLTVKLLSKNCVLSGDKDSDSGIPAKSGGRNEFHNNCRCNSSRSSECTNS